MNEKKECCSIYDGQGIVNLASANNTTLVINNLKFSRIDMFEEILKSNRGLSHDSQEM